VIGLRDVGKNRLISCNVEDKTTRKNLKLGTHIRIAKNYS